MILRDGIEDLEVLLNRVYDKEVKELVKEVIGCYSQGFYRASIISLWNAIVYDSFKKAKYLIGIMNDSKSEELLKSINNMIVSKNFAKELGLIKEFLQDKLQMINKHDVERLEQIQKLRNYCSHPSFAEDEKIYTPYPEEVRSNIRLAIEIILSKKPILGKKVMDTIIEDIQGQYFPKGQIDFEKILYDKYLEQSDKTLKINLLKFSAKKIFKSESSVLNTVPFGRVIISLSRKDPELITSTNLSIILEEIRTKGFHNLVLLIPHVSYLISLFSESLLIRLNTYLKETKDISEDRKLATKYLVSLENNYYNKEKILEEIKEYYEKKADGRVFEYTLGHKEILNNEMNFLFKNACEILLKVKGYTSAENFIKESISPLLNKINDESTLENLFSSVINNKKHNQTKRNQILEAGQIQSNLETIIESMNKKSLKMNCFNEFIETVNKDYLDPDDGIYEELKELIEKRLN